jgi:hypothetical protein
MATEMISDSTLTHGGAVDGAKLIHDTLKQFTTISSGSILLLATFLGQVFDDPRLIIAVEVSFLAFGVAIIGSMIAMAAIAGLLGGEEAWGDIRARSAVKPVLRWEHLYTIRVAGIGAAYIGFALGMTALAAFGLVNFQQ